MAESQAESLKPTQRARPQVIVVAAFMAFFHIACLGVIFTGTSTAAVATAIGMYIFRGMGITAGYHRLLAHRSFKANRFVQFIFALAGSLAVQGGPIWWVAHHRSHHRDTDTEEDIHSPVTHGMWKAHMGWMMTDEAFNENGANSRDLHKFPELKFLQRYYVWLILLEMISMFALGSWMAWAFPESGTSGMQMLVWGFFISTVFTWHVTFMVNSVCHRWGAQPYDTKDASTNNVFIGVLGFGEGWHNNHHFYPNSARHGLRWWQVDVTWYLIRTLQAIGVVSEAKLPKELRDRKGA